MKTLCLLRHAKSSWSDPQLQDFDRPLNKRGRRACSIMGPLLAERTAMPERVLCSPAKRTRETYERLAAHAPLPAPTFEPMLYAADVADLMTQLRTLPEGVSHAMVIGHNPGLQDLALALAHRHDDSALNRLEAKYPTGALAEIALDCDRWAELRPGVGRVTRFEIPKDHETA